MTMFVTPEESDLICTIVDRAMKLNRIERRPGEKLLDRITGRQISGTLPFLA